MRINVSTAYIFILIFLISMTGVIIADRLPASSIQLDGSSECNRCHGASHLGHVDYSVSLIISESILNQAENPLLVSIINNDFPLSDVTLTIIETTDYVVSETVKTQNLGTIGRGGAADAQWTIIPQVTENKSINIQIDFKGTARDHKVYTYTQKVTRGVFVSTVPTPLLFVQSSPSTDTVLLTGSEKQGGIVISNVGTLEMKNIQINASDIFLFEHIENQYTIPSLKPKQEMTFNFTINTSKEMKGSIEVSYAGETLQSIVIAISVQDTPPIPVSIVAGRIFGYLTFIVLFASVVTGVGRARLRKLLSGRKLRILHADLSNAGFMLVVTHAIVLTLKDSSWSQTYNWYELIPENLGNFDLLGLNYGRIGLFIMYISLVTGYYITKIIRKFGRSFGIAIHSLSYIAYLISVFHSIMIGGTAGNIIVVILMIASLFIVGWLKYEDYLIVKKRKARKRALSKKSGVGGKAKTKVTKAIRFVSEIKAVIDNPRVTCRICSTQNEFDANYCKNCASPMKEMVQEGD